MKDNQITANDNIKQIAVNDLVMEGLQIRVDMSDECIDNYADQYRENPNEMPPIVVFYDFINGKHYLADGFHRVMAVLKLNLPTIRAEVHEGTRDDAMRFALKANSRNGLQRTNADVQHAMELVWENWDTLFKNEKRTTPDGKPSVRQIMTLCATTLYKANTFINNNKLFDSNTPTSDGDENGDQETTDATKVTHDHIEERDPAVRALLKVGRDRFGLEIPERLVPVFNSRDPQLISKQLKEIREEFDRRHRNGDIVFEHIAPFAIDHLSSAIRDITYGLPFCVCRMCRGLGCASCSKLGFMTRSQYSMVPEEFKDSSRVRVARA